MEKAMESIPIRVVTGDDPLLPTTKPTTTSFITIPIKTVSSIILTVSLSVATVLQLLPYEYIDRNQVPTVIFNGLPMTFQAFVLCIVFAFSGSFCVLIVHEQNPKVAMVTLYYSALFMAFALAILLSSMCWTAFGLALLQQDISRIGRFEVKK